LADFPRFWQAFFAMIGIITDEEERPAEWLRRFQEDPRRYARLVQEAGSLACAAYRLARARCRIQVVPTAIPTLREVLAAARQLVRLAGEATPLIPSLLIFDCEQAGLPIIAPLGTAAA
jgi:hypothetical protein